MKLKWNNWLYNLGKTTIGGVAATVTAYFGTLVGNQVDASIQALNWRQLGFVLLASTITNLFFYLKQSPLPEDEDAAK